MFKYKIQEMISAAEIQTAVQKIADQINRDYEGKEIVLVGLLRGSVMFLADLARHIKNPHITIDFMSVSSYGHEMQTSGEIKILKDLDENIKDKNVIIVEDIIDTGFTLDKISKLLWSREPRSLTIATLLDKPECRISHVDVQYIGFQIPNEFVVGYGIDYAQMHRALPYIAKVIKDEK
ncbi:hypoxanthine phosphoribosyltransferase [Ureaplasma miroungigenitalium]|uniref:Hypoxanthine phosphoribosyltransferase n=1 Tax=Ureaplasma miroungigenitalium TaxID=1042321 RepID=A0ABT3BN21_9BACT|nr:hypoxanthine phosphoribosyltransferase [Ureaplasma miroungigenitalium]MCV3728427.1 hypoxanthine phosphoribosyltransferase [Ureaplasma miroungigenitalium]MCV3734214.1 hypoxanthine phosphoribosyltransferase [Ureaplasma miroungigenitalium]